MVRIASDLVDTPRLTIPLNRVLLVLFLLWLSLLTPAWAETLPFTIWQSEKRYLIKNGDTVRLHRRPFNIVTELKGSESLGLVAAEGKRKPEDFLGFGDARAMAGPYDGLYLTWSAYHNFYIGKTTHDIRMHLWDRGRGLSYWRVNRLFDNEQAEAQEIAWKDCQDLYFLVRKRGFSDIEFKIRWID